MNCPNCGAPMQLRASSPVWTCDHCRTSIQLGAGIDGLDVDRNGTSSYTCPVCHHQLAPATMDRSYRLDACTECQGLLLPIAAFGTTVETKRLFAMTPSKMPPADATGNLKRTIACPSCGERMITDWYYGPGRVVIDTCESCGLVWLDGGELQRVIDAPGPDRLA
jgi:Zn-finger nucleic acid-binding protein